MIRLPLNINFSLIISGLFLISSVISAQQPMDRLPPQVLTQLKAMTPAQQKEFAKRYNLELPYDLYEVDVGGKLGKQGMPLEQVEDKPITSPLFNDNEKPQRFGLSFFSQEVSTFAPVDDISVPDNYVLGVGDSLVIQMMGTSTERYDLEIERDGTVFLERLGVISIAGLSLKQAVEMIETRVANELFGKTVSINIGKLKAMNVFLAGEVRYPGMYSVSSLTTVTQALYQAGGISQLGSLRNIQILRNGINVNTFDVYDLLIKGDSTNDIRLKSGDVVLVSPYKAIAEVKGESRRPMFYEVISGETVADLIRMSSGFSEYASPSEAVLLTKASSGSPLNALTLNLLNENDLNTLIGVNDTLIIPSANIAARNYIEISGAANRTGFIGWQKGMKLTDVLTDINKDFPDYVDLDFSLIVRKPDRFSNLIFLKFSLRQLFQDKNFKDIELLEYDHILFFSTTPNEADLQINQSFIESREDLKSPTLIDDSLSEIKYEKTKPDDLADNYVLSKQSKQFTRVKLLKPFLDLVKLESDYENPPPLVSILGAVRYPGTYPLFQDASAYDLIEAAGGFTNEAFTDSIELKRPKLKSMTYEFDTIELNQDQNNYDVASTKLEPLDHLTVRQYSGRDELNTITLSGEIIFPGEYIIGKEESISSVIDRAGGFNENAFIKGAVYLKQSVKDAETERLQNYSNQIKRNYSSSSLTREVGTSIALNEIEPVLKLLESVKPNGRVAIDLESEDIDDFIVGDGDTLYIPKKISTVSIAGEVNIPNSVEYSDNLTIEDYLQLAGGLTKRADKNNLYIIKANGSTLVLDKSYFRLFARKPKIEPGDTIIAPINIQYRDSLTNWTQVTQLIYQSMVSIAAVKGL